MSANEDTMTLSLAQAPGGDKDATRPGVSPTDPRVEIMQLLHEYNEIKDAAQIVLGALASMPRLRIKDMHKKYNLPLSDVKNSKNNTI